MMIIFNGCSSSGKSSLIKGLLSSGDFWFKLGIDDYFTNVPREYVEFGIHSKEYIHFERQGDNINTCFGPIGYNFINAFTKSLNIFSQSINVLTDEVFLDDKVFDMYANNIDPNKTFLIGVYCSKTTALQREEYRNSMSISKETRIQGLMSSQFDIVHNFESYYDLKINTDLDLSINIANISQYIINNKPIGFNKYLNLVN